MSVNRITNEEYKLLNEFDRLYYDRIYDLLYSEYKYKKYRSCILWRAKERSLAEVTSQLFQLNLTFSEKARINNPQEATIVHTNSELALPKAQVHSVIPKLPLISSNFLFGKRVDETVVRAKKLKENHTITQLPIVECEPIHFTSIVPDCR